MTVSVPSITHMDRRNHIVVKFSNDRWPSSVSSMAIQCPPASGSSGYAANWLAFKNAAQSRKVPSQFFGLVGASRDPPSLAVGVSDVLDDVAKEGSSLTFAGCVVQLPIAKLGGRDIP
jgi:hypothetical protein